MGLMDDLMLVSRGMPVVVDDTYHKRFEEYRAAQYRLRDFIEQHEPWYPPQQEGFGSWVEYTHGKDDGPPVMAKIRVLTQEARQKKLLLSDAVGHPAYGHYWGPGIVAYCVKLDEAKP